jgi:uncharacterized protein (TIGR02145 family)
MKKLFVILAIAVTMTLYAQSPQKMSYQAVIRNADNILVPNHAIGMKISILQGDANGAEVYTETLTPITNDNGLVSVEIGGQTGFDTINWASGSYFIKTETDPAGGTNYTISGTSQLLSVPYALHAKTAEKLTGGNTETDPIFNGSVAKGITATDTINWNKTYDNKTLDLSEVLVQNNDGGGLQIKNIADPTEAQDAATKTYVDNLSTQINLMKNTIKAGGPVTDIDGNVYNTVKIGNQKWLAENMRASHDTNGILLDKTDNFCYAIITTGRRYGWQNNDSAKYNSDYGKVYNLAAAKSVCPTGWHLSTSTEWNIMVNYLGGSNVAGTKLKEAGTVHWDSPNTATNESGFTALPGSYWASGWQDAQWRDRWNICGSYCTQDVCPYCAGLYVRCVKD